MPNATRPWKVLVPQGKLADLISALLVAQSAYAERLYPDNTPALRAYAQGQIRLCEEVIEACRRAQL